jgi:hypothetical protein
MSSSKPRSGWGIEDRANKQPPAPDAGVPVVSGNGAPPLLAQIPDLDATNIELAADESTDGRIISQGFSIKLVMGVGFIMLMCAVLPYVLNKRKVEDVNPLHDWHANGQSASAGPTATSSGTASAAPTPASGGAQVARSVPTNPPAYLSPQPQVGTNQAMALADPGWPPAPAASTPRGQYNNAQNRPADARTGDRADYRQYDRAPDPRNYNADTRSDPATIYRGSNAPGDYRNDGRGQARNDVRASDPRYDYPSPGNVQGNPLMPANGTGAPATSYQNPQVVDPGVARFDGTITKPTVRTSYDRSGPSNY